MLRTFTTILALSFCAASPAQSLTPVHPTDILVTVPANPAKYGKARRLNKKRFQFEADSASISLRVAQTSRLPVKAVKMAVDNNKLIAFRRDTMGGYIREEQNAAWQTLLEMGRVKPKAEAAYRESVERFIGGKSVTSMTNQWHTLASMPMNSNRATVSAKVRAGLFRRPLLTTDTLPGAEPLLLPAVDTNPCVPFDRFYERRKLRGYGIDKFHYTPYRRTMQKVVRQQFEVYFEKNSTQADLTEVRQFLTANRLSILYASMEGFSSVEGTAERNRELQEQRASRLFGALRSFNKLPVESDTILFTDAWEPFREELRRSPYRSLDSLGNESLRDTINHNPELLAWFEPYLRQHRKAALKLTLAGALSREDVVKRLVSDFNYELGKVKAGDFPANRETEAKLMGMISYYEQLALAAPEDSLRIAALVDNSDFPTEARLLLFYHVIKQYEERKNMEVSWDSVFMQRGWSNLFSVAALNAMRQAEGAPGCRYPTSFTERKKRMEQLVDVQYYTFKYIREGILDAEVLCGLNYPPSPRYYGYRLNHLAMAHELSKTRHFSCFGFSSPAAPQVARLRPDSASIDSLINTVMAERFVPPSGPGSRVPTYDGTEKGDYYFYVKMLAAGQADAIRQFVQTSDNYFEFDLYYLLRINVSRWDPYENHFYDKDIGPLQMRQLLLRLKSLSRHLCPTDANQLYLDFYIKSLMYFERHRAPGDSGEMNLAEQSMRGITAYYASHPRMLFPRMVLLITRQLHRYYWLPTKRSSLGYARDVMAAAETKRVLSYEEEKQWEVYGKLFRGRRR